MGGLRGQWRHCLEPFSVLLPIHFKNSGLHRFLNSQERHVLTCQPRRKRLVGRCHSLCISAFPNVGFIQSSSFVQSQPDSSASAGVSQCNCVSQCLTLQSNLAGYIDGIPTISFDVRCRGLGAGTEYWDKGGNSRGISGWCTNIVAIGIAGVSAHKTQTRTKRGATQAPHDGFDSLKFG